MRQNIQYLLFLCCLCAHITVSIAQTKHSTDYPLYLQVDQSQNKVQPTDFEGWLKTKLQLSKEVALQPLGAEKDQLGFTHQRYQVTQSGIPIEGAVVISHSNQEKMLTAYNGSLFKVGNIQTKPNFTSKEALQKALNYVAAKTYRWENEEGVEPPTPELVIAPKDLDFQIKDFRLCYKIDIYAIEPFERQWIYVDAQSGEIIATQNKLCTSHNHTATKHSCSTTKTSPTSFPSIPNLPLADTEGTAVTKYSGTQTITTDQQNNRYLLQEQGRNIITYNLYKTKNFNAATVFEDDDNYWDNINENQDEIATDVHWATEQTYDYFLETHGRKSFDGQGITVRSYVHYLNPTFGTTFANAFWDGEHLVYGDGNGDNRGPLTSLDICAHEYTHAVTDYTANLINGRESGALNESFSDILSIAVENYAKPSTANFFLGEDVALDERGAIRNATDPKSFEDPDTYGGEYWSLNQTHNRSNVQTHWFYLLVNGGEGVNDLDQPYQVTGISLEAATAIAYRNLTVYLTPPATYADARFFSIRAAMDLYGDCSFEAEQVVKAWYAVGLGESEELKVAANFAVSENQFCSEEANVDFSNHSIHANSYHWDFGDGSSSSEVNPTHDYQGFGNYTVQLIATSCDGEKDTIIQENLIQLDTESITCNSHNFDPSEQLNLTACKGVLYDNGGPLGDYVKNEEIRVTIEIEDADYITLDFKQFDASNSHELYIYDGNSQNAHRIGTYWGSRLPNDGETIVSTGNALHLRFNTYGGEERTFPGFEVEWKCHQTSQKPVVDFERPSPTSDTFECTGAGTLTDRTLYQPTEWFWDFGDG
ncbi:MAG: M4 family metallopeptidase, partial [Chitinophagales bacterium]